MGFYVEEVVEDFQVDETGGEEGYRHVLSFFNLFDSFNTQMELPR